MIAGRRRAPGRPQQSDAIACGTSCRSVAGVLPSGDADVVFRAYFRQVKDWARLALSKMRMPVLDHHGRLVRASNLAGTDQAASSIRRLLMDEGYQFIPLIVDEVEQRFHLAARRGVVCLAHLRAFLRCLSDRASWELGTKKSRELMRERLVPGGTESVDVPSDLPNPEAILIAKEERRESQLRVRQIDAAIAQLPVRDAVIVRGRMQDPPRRHSAIGEELGMGESVVRLRHLRACALLERIIREGWKK